MCAHTAMDTFPEEWSRKARCPICKGGFLQIKHQNHTSDQMHCPKCQISFYIEKSGEQLFFTDTPEDFPVNITNRWVTRREISEQLAKSTPKVRSAALNIPTANPLRAEAVRRARTLVELGNSREDVHRALAASMQLTEFAINEIITDAFRVNQIKQKKRSKNTLVFTSIIIAGIILLFIFLFILLQIT